MIRSWYQLYYIKTIQGVGFYLLLTLFSIVVASQEELHIKLVSAELAPFTYTNDKGIIVGHITEKVKAVFEHAGIKHTFKSIPWNRAIMETKNNATNLLYPLTRLKEREHDYQWIFPVRESVYQVYGLKDKHNFETVDLSKNKYRFICGKNTIQCAILNELEIDERNITRLSSIDLPQYVKMLQQSRADFIVIDTERVKTYAEEAGISETDLKAVQSFSFLRVEYLAGNHQVDKKLIERLQSSYKALYETSTN